MIALAKLKRMYDAGLAIQKNFQIMSKGIKMVSLQILMMHSYLFFSSLSFNKLKA
jgi:hypothetical protein